MRSVNASRSFADHGDERAAALIEAVAADCPGVSFERLRASDEDAADALRCALLSKGSVRVVFPVR